jgi:probable rRNA maturation factor
VVVVGPKTIQKLNATYRKKDKPTDVLSFSRMNSGLPNFYVEESDLGEVLICWDIAKKQAREYKSSIQEELERLTVHGVLHLFGYDHEISPAEEKRMFNLQEQILKVL